MTAATGLGWGHRVAALLLLLLLVGSALYLLVDRILIARYHYYHDALEQLSLIHI